MKKIFRGFTLAEVLVTLGIVGVIAALTMPGVISSSQNQQNGVRLAATVSTIEKALATMIAEEDVRNLYGTKAWVVVQDAHIDPLTEKSNEAVIRSFVGNLKQYLNITDYYKQTQTEYYGTSIKSISGATDHKGEDGAIGALNAFPVELKNGATVFFRVYPKGDGSTKTTAAERQAVIDAGGSLFSDAADVYIDVNGKKSPNTIGRDLFTFYVGSDGVLYAAGGRDVAAYENTTLWSDSNSMWACTDTTIKNHGWGCTAMVIAEGYKITY